MITLTNQVFKRKDQRPEKIVYIFVYKHFCEGFKLLGRALTTIWVSKILKWSTFKNS